MNLKNLLKNIAQRIKSLEYNLGLIRDYVVESYYTQDARYVKWESGKCEIWKRISKTLNATTKWGSMYYGAYYGTEPITYTMTGFDGFLDYPIVQVMMQSNGGNLFGFTGDQASYTKTGIGNYYVYSADSRQNVYTTFNVYAVGKWK